VILYSGFAALVLLCNKKRVPANYALAESPLIPIFSP